MSDTTSSANDARPGEGATQDEMVRYDEVMRILNGWRARLDELRVQVDLAKLDLRDEGAKQLELGARRECCCRCEAPRRLQRRRRYCRDAALRGPRVSQRHQ